MGGENVQSMRRRPLDARLCAALLALLCVFHAGMNLWNQHRARGAIQPVERVHVEKAREYYKTFFESPQDSALQSIIALAKISPAAPSYPPLLHLSGATALYAAGGSTKFLGLLNSAFLALLLLGFFLLCRRVLDPWEAIFAAFALSLVPGVYEQARVFTPSTLTAALSVWSVYALLKSAYFRDLAWTLLFAVLLGCAMLSDAASIKHLTIPAMAALILGVRAVREQGRVSRLLLQGAIAAAVACSVFSPWYFRHLDAFYEAPAAMKGEAPAARHVSSVSSADMGLEASAGAGQDPAQNVPMTKTWFERIWLVLAITGVLVTFASPRFRVGQMMVLLAWFAGSGALPMLAARGASADAGAVLSLFAVAPILILPWVHLRRTASGLLALALVLQFAYLAVPGGSKDQSPSAGPVTPGPGAMDTTPALVPFNIRSTAEVDQLSFIDLFRYRNTVGLEVTHPDLKAYSEKRFQAMIDALHPKPQRICPALQFIHAGISRGDGDFYQVMLIFFVEQQIGTDWNIYLQGQVPPDGLQFLPEAQRALAHKRWDFAPTPSTSRWRAGDYMIVVSRIQAERMRYNMEFGFALPDGRTFGQSVSLGPVDFAAF